MAGGDGLAKILAEPRNHRVQCLDASGWRSRTFTDSAGGAISDWTRSGLYIGDGLCRYTSTRLVHDTNGAPLFWNYAHSWITDGGLFRAALAMDRLVCGISKTLLYGLADHHTARISPDPLTARAVAFVDHGKVRHRWFWFGARLAESMAGAWLRARQRTFGTRALFQICQSLAHARIVILMTSPAAFRLPALTFREWDGAFTSELVREPGAFGLGQVPKHLQPNGTAKAICGFCSTGCGLQLHLRDGEAVNLTPDTNYPVNLGMACPKGWEALTPLAASDRGTTPLLHGSPVSWDTALRKFTTEFQAIQEQHGKASIAFISTGQMMCEDMAYLGAVAKFGMGMQHGDGNTRQCMATAVTAYKQSFGFDAPPFTYADFEMSDVLVFVGANPCIAHPIMWQRVMRNPNHPEIIVIDPRKTETAMAATQHLPLLPKSDLTLLYVIAKMLIDLGAVQTEFVEAHTTEFAAFAEFLEAFPLSRGVAECGLSEAALRRVAETIASGKAVSFWWTMGVNQGHQATRTAQAIINLALMTGNIGRPGTGANSITGQCNAMGSRLFSNTTNLLGGHDFLNAAHREKVAAALEIPVERIPSQNSWAYDQIIQGIHDGAIKGLWIIATNGAHSWINQTHFKEAMAKLDFLVVQDMYASTETAAMAHLYLPAAGWGEKEGTFINSERRIGLSRKVRKAPGEALADFSIFRLVAHYYGCGELFLAWTSPEAVFRILQRCSEDQPCDITGIQGYEMLEASGGVQWPCPSNLSSPAQERRLFADGNFFTPDQRAKFLFDLPAPPPENTSEAFPFILLTGRGTSAQWHTGSRTDKSAVLRKLYPSTLGVEIHPSDAAALRIADASLVIVSTARGEITATARVAPTVQPGQLFLPMHDKSVNLLTASIFDPLSRQPSYKHCAAAIRLK
jgi:anaerobic selenocysteine-containing dehydrogenase